MVEKGMEETSWAVAAMVETVLAVTVMVMTG